MKRLLIILSFLGLAAILPSCKTESQVRLHVGVNIGSQPPWGPQGYSYVEYYYLPAIDVYYHVTTRQFVYMQGGEWVTSYYLPPWCSHYDLYSAQKVVINESAPYLHTRYYQRRYWGDNADRRDNDDRGRHEGHEHGRHH